MYSVGHLLLTVSLRPSRELYATDMSAAQLTEVAAKEAAKLFLGLK